jgi:hypothetical protein
MLQSRLFLIGCVLVALLGLPREGNAGIVEVIIEMSGPKMYGFSVDCRLDFQGTWQSCKTSVATKDAVAPLVQDRRGPFWLSLGGGYYWSADKTVNGQDYDRFEVKMVTFDPMIEFASKSWPVGYAQLPVQVYHGLIGLSYNVLFGESFPTFSNVGLKLRPFGIVIPVKGRFAFDFSYDIRLYPTGFTAEDFGHIPLAPEGPGAEAVQSLVFGVRVKLD